MNKLARNTLALGTATLIVTAGLSFSANGADPIVAQANSSAVTATGLTQIVDSKTCRVSSTGPATNGTADVCGTGLSTQGVNAFAQTAETGLDGTKGTSKGASSVAPINIAALTTINLSTIPTDLTSVDTGTVLDPLLTNLTPIVQTTLDTALGLLGISLQQLLDQIQTAAIAPITSALQTALPVAVEVGALSSQCMVTAGGTPNLTSQVAGINIVVGNNRELVVPVAVGTGANLPLVGSVAIQQIVDDAFAGIEAALNQSLSGALGPLAAALPGIQATLVDSLLTALAPVVDALGQAVVPILTGTVNKQVTNADGSGEVTALDLNLLSSTATLKLARSACGPNGAVVVNTPTPTPTPKPTKTVDTDTAADADAAADAAADADTVADADAAADADVTTTLPSTGAPNLVPFWLLGIALLMFGGAVLLNEKRRLNQI